MAKQTVGLGSSANDGTGDSLRVGGDKINDNFNELYTAIGTGTALNITTAGASSNQILQWSTSNNRFEPTNSAAAGDISVDLTPQLGGDLDVNGNKIVSATNGDIELIPHGTGKIKLDTLTFFEDMLQKKTMEEIINHMEQENYEITKLDVNRIIKYLRYYKPIEISVE